MKSSNATTQKMQKFMVEKVAPISNRISNEPHLAALRDGLVNLVPYTVLGGFSTLIASPPVDPKLIKPSNWFFKLLLGWYYWEKANSKALLIPYNLSIGIISVYVVLGVAYQLAKHYKLAAFPTSLISLMSFLSISSTLAPDKTGQWHIALSDLSSNSMFAAIIVALVSVQITHFMNKHKMTIKLPSSVPPNVTAPFEALLPLVFNILFWIILDSLSKTMFNVGLSNLIFKLFEPILHVGASLPAMMFLSELALIFWFFGIHGDNMIGAVITPIVTANIAQNMQEYAAGKQITNIFANNFHFIFGEAVVYCAILWSMLIFAKSPQLHTLSRFALPANLFNINEPQVFGIPTVMNLLTFIPSFICLFLDLPIAYFATKFNLMNKTVLSLPWTMPAPLYAIISTLDWRAGLVWLIEFFLDLAIMIPFMKMYDNQLIEEDKMSSKS